MNIDGIELKDSERTKCESWFMKEIWKDIPEWEGLYQISNLGRIKSVKRDKVKVLDINNAGYARVQLCDDKRRKK